jgi:transcription elongation factor Elf1
MKNRHQCPACLSNHLEVVYEESYAAEGVQSYLERHYEGRASNSADGYDYRLAACQRCGLTFQQEVPDDDLLGEVYNSWVPGTELEREHRDYSLDEYRYLAEQIQFVIQYFKTSPGSLNMLDFGFGWAHWSKMAMAYGCCVSGVELSEERSQHGRGIGINVLNLEQLPPSQFHFIHTEQVFEHLTAPREVLARLVSSLLPGGLIKISVPDAGHTLKKISQGTQFGALSPADQMSIAPLEHINAFSYDSLVLFGKTLGLKPLRPSFYQLYNSASGLLQVKNLLRVLARPVYRHVYPRSTFVYFQKA